MDKKGTFQLPLNPKQPGRPPVADRTSSLPQPQLPNVSPKRPRDTLLGEIENAKRQKLAARASRDSLNQISDVGWWTQDKIMHHASSRELRAQIELLQMTPQKSAQAFEDSTFELQVVLEEELEAAAASRDMEVRKELALLEAAKIEKENINPSTLTQSTNAFLSITTEILFPVVGQQRDPAQQATWKTALFFRYNVLLDSNPSSMIGKSVKSKKALCKRPGAQAWCPVMQAYKTVNRRKAAHIVPHRLGQTGFKVFFGKDNDQHNASTWSLRNGMILDKDIEILFDRGVIVITPCSSDPRETDFETRVLRYESLDEDIHSGNSVNGCNKVRDLHGRRLIFKNKERPGKRFLYLMYCAALYKASREGKTQVVQTELRDNKDVWATPGRYVRENMLQAMAANMGHDSSKLHPKTHALESKKIDSPKAAAAEVSEYHKVAKTLKDEMLDQEGDEEEEDEPKGFDAYQFLKADKEWDRYD